MHTRMRIFAICVVIAVPGAVALADFPNSDATRWVQLPDNNDGLAMNITGTRMIADDWYSTASAPITGLHLWGMWRNDQLPTIFGGSASATNASFVLSIHSNVPASGSNPARPGAQIWSKTFGMNTFTARTWQTGLDQDFYPDVNGGSSPASVLYQYSFNVPANEAFIPATGSMYWLAIECNPLFDPYAQGDPAEMAWLTSLSQFGAPAQLTNTGYFGGDPTTWASLAYPANHALEGGVVQAAFALTSPHLPEPAGLGVLGTMAILARRRR